MLNRLKHIGIDYTYIKSIQIIEHTWNERKYIQTQETSFKNTNIPTNTQNTPPPKNKHEN